MDTTHVCDRCESPATIHFRRAVQVAGITGLVRHLCCHHARGLRGHRGCTACAEVKA